MTHVIHKIYSRVKLNNPDRSTNDFYPTPPVATYSLLKQFPEFFAQPRIIHEPAAGKGWISRELERNGHRVISQDLYEYPGAFMNIDTGKDFLESTTKYGDVMITNPPFAQNGAEMFVRKSIELGHSFTAILARLTFLESATRHKLFKEHPPHSVHVFSGRINCDEKMFESGKQVGGLIAYAWFVWIKNVARLPRTDLRWINTAQMYERWKAEQ